MSGFTEQRSLPELLKELMNDLTMLFRKEVQLAKVEAGEKVQKALAGVEMLLVAAVLGIAAVGILLTAAVAGLSAALQAAGMGQTGASALSALIIGGIAAGVAYMLFKRGMGSLRADNLMLDRTTHSLASDAAVIKEKTNG